MTIAAIRDTMQFEESYIVPAYDLEIRLYTTRRQGAYGYQWAAIAWYKGEGYASDKTGGYGYDKPSTAVAQALARACGKDKEKAQKMHNYGGTGQIQEAIAEFLGFIWDREQWQDEYNWRKNNIVHAHG